MNKCVRFFEYESSWKFLAILPAVPLECLEDYAGENTDYDVDNLRGNKRKVDDANRSVFRLIGSNVVCEPIFKGNRSGVLRLDDRPQPVTRKKGPDTQVQGLHKLR